MDRAQPPVPLEQSERPATALGSGMSRSQGSKLSSGVRACMPCRKMKMKCIGSTNPPCERCRKARRKCIPSAPSYTVVAPQEQYNRNTEPFPPSTNIRETDRIENRQVDLTAESNSSAQVTHDPNSHSRIRGDPFKGPSSAHTEPTPSHSEFSPYLPSIFSTSPAEAVTLSSRDEGLPMHQSKRRMFEKEGYMRHDICSEQDIALSRQDMYDMVEMFCARVLPYIPILGVEDFRDIDHLITNNKTLVYCVCYVMASYLPGGKGIRTELRSKISQILTGAPLEQGGAHLKHDFTSFKALIILYAYTDLSPPSWPPCLGPTDDKPVPFWPLKSIVETRALQMSLQRSIHDLKLLIASKSATIFETAVFQKYASWMWLFTMAHCSIITGTPPTIGIDSTIRAAPSLLQQIGAHPRIDCLLGEVELCLIWEEASAQHPQIREWWCLPDETGSVEDRGIEIVMQQATKAIDNWYNRWWGYIQKDYGFRLDFYGRFTRFCITSYAVRAIRNSPRGLSPAQRDRLTSCFASANHLLRWVLELGPVQKDRLRYVAEFGAVMLTFCCLFIISACQAYHNSISGVAESIDAVAGVAHLMNELTPKNKYKTYNYGGIILTRLEDIRAVLESPNHGRGGGIAAQDRVDVNEITPLSNAPGAWLESLGFTTDVDGSFEMEPIWDFSFLFPSN